MSKINFIFIDDRQQLNELFRQLIADESVQYAVHEDENLTVTEDVKKTVTELIQGLGIPANIKGYTYLRDAILICFERPAALNSVTKVLYPEVALKNATTSTRVERAIRHAIEVAWDRGNEEAAMEIFGRTSYTIKEKPTNSEFIALIADKVRIIYGQQTDASAS